MLSQIMKADAPEAGVFQDGQEVAMVEVLGLQNSSSFGRKDEVAGDALLALEISSYKRITLTAMATEDWPVKPISATQTRISRRTWFDANRLGTTKPVWKYFRTV